LRYAVSRRVRGEKSGGADNLAATKLFDLPPIKLSSYG
jgi:hypothetical protein